MDQKFKALWISAILSLYFSRRWKNYDETSENNYDVNQGSQAARQLVDFLVAILITRSFYNYLKKDRAVSSNIVHTSDFWDRSRSDFKNLERF